MSLLTHRNWSTGDHDSKYSACLQLLNMEEQGHRAQHKE